ncbi:YbaK/EbsC family protein [Saxibacter everestensis]|uniref:YbaK/EbsC family protein n=1 Tax=Saxibacter everestensis TaxID=2909229 RepID=A0ABY8QQ43_9MICO|nr:YbaK/EbsC family protein [Brevibacteriaceae bacterium ZFBP1038]
MHRNTQLVHDALEAHGIAPEILELGAGAHTAQAAADQLEIEIGAIANSLIFTADDHLILVMTSGAHRVDTKYLATAIGVRKVGRASAEQVRSATGQPIGGVAPTGHPGPVPTYIDSTLSRFPELWAGAGTPATMLRLTYPELVRLTNGTEVDVTNPEEE